MPPIHLTYFLYHMRLQVRREQEAEGAVVPQHLVAKINK